MKKLSIYLILCFLCFCSLGQGTAYFMESNYNNPPKFIRKYDNSPGAHVTLSADIISGQKELAGLTDIYFNYYYAQITDKCVINDFETMDYMAYFCGRTITNKGLIGWFNITGLIGGGVTVYLDTTSLASNGITSVDNIEVYTDVTGNVHLAGYGTGTLGYMGFDFMQTPPLVWKYMMTQLPYMPCDLTVTDKYVVIAGLFSADNKIVIHPFPKNGGMFSPSSVPYYYYHVGSGTTLEPYSRMFVEDVGNDVVTTLTYRLEGGGIYKMMLRSFDVSMASVTYQAPMVVAYEVPFNYSATQAVGFKYDADRKCYLALQNYEVAPSDFRDVVTSVDFLGGVPTSVRSDYFSSSTNTFSSLSLSDSSMYVAYGHDSGSTENVFWKDAMGTTAMGPCLLLDILPFNNTTPVPEVVQNYPCGLSYVYLINAISTTYPANQANITPICH